MMEKHARIEALRDRLVSEAEERLEKPPSRVVFTEVDAADELLNDLQGHPHAFVIACIMDRQVTASVAWAVLYKLGQRLGPFEFEALAARSEEAILKAMHRPTPLHRFPDIMGKFLYAAVRRIETVYDGDASRIWADEPPNASIVRRFLEFKGVGPKIATMAANILVRDFRVPVSDKYSIDISADVHVKRVFERLGLVEGEVDNDMVIYTARELYPEYPGIFDYALWDLGQRVAGRATHCAVSVTSRTCVSTLMSAVAK
jgi:endonuclease III